MGMAKCSEHLRGAGNNSENKTPKADTQVKTTHSIGLTPPFSLHGSPSKLFAFDPQRKSVLINSLYFLIRGIKHQILSYLSKTIANNSSISSIFSNKLFYTFLFYYTFSFNRIS